MDTESREPSEPRHPQRKARPPFPGLSDERLEEIAGRARATLAGLVTYQEGPRKAGMSDSVTMLTRHLVRDQEDLLTLVTALRRARGLTAPDNSE